MAIPRKRLHQQQTAAWESVDQAGHPRRRAHGNPVAVLSLVVLKTAAISAIISPPGDGYPLFTIRRSGQATHRATDQQDQSVQADARRRMEPGVAATDADDRCYAPGAFGRHIRRLWDDRGCGLSRSRRKEAWDIDTWLMSCRVLGRNVEQAMLTRVAEQAGTGGAQWLVGTYIHATKNSRVAEHCKDAPFLLCRREDDGRTRCNLELSGYVIPKIPIFVEDVSSTSSS